MKTSAAYLIVCATSSIALATGAPLPADTTTQNTPTSKALENSIKESSAWADKKEKEAKEHWEKAKELNDRVQGAGRHDALNNADKAVVSTGKNLIKGAASYLGGRKDKTFNNAANSIRDTLEAKDRLERIAVDLADSDLKSKADKAKDAGDAAAKDAKLMRDHVEIMKQWEAKERAKEKAAAVQKVAPNKSPGFHRDGPSRTFEKNIERYNRELRSGFDRTRTS
jgi:hypothetical protein